MQLDRINSLKRLKTELKLYELAKKVGIDKSLIEEIKEEFADRVPEKGVNYYYYNGPLDAKTRPFCRLMLTIGKVFSEEQIEYISKELNYPVLEYKGSFGCRHQWVKFRGRRISTPPPTQREIRKLINSGEEYSG